MLLRYSDRVAIKTSCFADIGVIIAIIYLYRCMSTLRLMFHYIITEHEILFKPTYKLDKQQDTYDSSSKRRIPGWTDRIFYKSKTSTRVTCLSYNAEFDLKTSDHRPVYASFVGDINLEGVVPVFDENLQFSSNSQVCSIMWGRLVDILILLLESVVYLGTYIRLYHVCDYVVRGQPGT